MTTTSISAKLPWENRWTEPTLDQLLRPLPIHQRRLFKAMMRKLAEFEGMRYSLAWYGEAWNWTIQYKLVDADGQPYEDVCFLVPSLPAMQVCVPLSDEFIAELPMRRLTRYVRDGIGIAKSALVTHWASWSPNNQTESNALLDLLKRKVKFALEPVA